MRYIICQACADKGTFNLTKLDIQDGFKERKVPIPAVKRPVDLARAETVIKDGHLHYKRTLLESIECDGCGDRVPNGQPVVAITHWRNSEPPAWEHEYA